MRRLLLLLAGVLVVVLFAWWAGYSSEHAKRGAAERQLAELRSRLDQVDAQVRLCAIDDRLDQLVHQVRQRNFGLAQEASSRFFDEVRQEAGRAPDAMRPHLTGILETRDRVTAALVRGDTTVLDALRGSADKLRLALGRQPIFEPREDGLASSGETGALPAAPDTAGESDAGDGSGPS